MSLNLILMRRVNAWLNKNRLPTLEACMYTCRMKQRWRAIASNSIQQELKWDGSRWHKRLLRVRKPRHKWCCRSTVDPGVSLVSGRWQDRDEKRYVEDLATRQDALACKLDNALRNFRISLLVWVVTFEILSKPHPPGQDKTTSQAKYLNSVSAE